MDLLLLGGVTLGLGWVAAIVLNARQPHEQDLDLDRCERCGAQLNTSPLFLDEAGVPVRLPPACAACGALDTRLAWLGSRDWD